VVDGSLQDSTKKHPEPPNQRRIAANFVTLAVTSALGLVVTILISIYVRRAIGPVAMGQVSWSLAVIGYLGLIVNPGLTTIGQRHLAGHPSRGNELVGLLLTLQTVLSAVVYVLLIGISAFDFPGPAISTLLLIQGLTLFLTSWNTGWVLQAHERMVAPSIAALAINMLQLPVLLLFVHSPGDVNLYAFLALPFALAGVIFNFWYISRHGAIRLSRLRATFSGARMLLRESWAVGLSQTAVLIVQSSGIVILGIVRGDDAVGQYATAYRLMMVATFITASLWNAFFPALSRAATSPAEASLLSRQFLRLLAWIGCPLAALGWACGRHVVELMYGVAFAQSGPYFEWLCLVIALSYVNYGLVAIMVPLGRSALQFQIVAIAAAVTLAINALAIPLYGAWGCIAALIAGEVVMLGLGLSMRSKLHLLKYPIVPVVAPPLLCSLGVAAVIAMLPASYHRFWWLELTIGGLVLLLCLLGFERRNLQWLGAAVFDR
jgi:O-antigen/teichoic acid export membrane protein